MPDSPVISTATLERDRRPMARNTCCIAGALPNNSGISGVCAGVSSLRRAVCPARRTSSTAWSMSKGFGRYSNAPPSYADTALGRSECAVMTITGSVGCAPRTSRSRSMPELPGMRMSVSSTSGASARSAASAGSAASKARGTMPLARNARSSTQRMDASSSTSQTRSAG